MAGRLHLVTDHRLGARVPQFVTEALAGGADGGQSQPEGCTCRGVDTVQVRVAAATSDREALELTQELLRRCRTPDLACPRGHRVTCLVNDRVDVALAAGADGVHLGARDLPVGVARRLLGPRAVIGATARDPVSARRAQDDGANYLGVGPLRATRTKAGLPAPLGLPGIAAVAASVQIPVIAIGGITAGDVPALLAAGAHGVAVVSALSAARDPGTAVGELRRALASGTSQTSQQAGADSVSGRLDITVNGTARSVPAPATIAWLVADLLGQDPGAVAVACNGTVLPRSSWAQQVVRPADRIDVITALQGG